MPPKEEKFHRYLTPRPCPVCEQRTSELLVFVTGNGPKPLDVGIPKMIGRQVTSSILAVFEDEQGNKVYGQGGGQPILTCRGCGRLRLGVRVQGVYNSGIKCNARCQSATGFSCECSCGGKNHGAGFDVHASEPKQGVLL